MTEIGMVDAKAHFSDLLRRVSRGGEEFVVTVRGRPTALLRPLDKAVPDARDIEELLGELRAFRAKVADRGSILKAGETWNEFAREGLD